MTDFCLVQCECTYERPPVSQCKRSVFIPLNVFLLVWLQWYSSVLRNKGCRNALHTKCPIKSQLCSNWGEQSRCLRRQMFRITQESSRHIFRHHVLLTCLAVYTKNPPNCLREEASAHQGNCVEGGRRGGKKDRETRWRRERNYTFNRF